MFEGLPVVNKISMPEQVFQTLRAALISGRFEPGQRIPLRTIAAAVGTSTMPAREAVNRLIALGALVLLPNRRVSVPTLTRQKYRDLATARMILEGAAAEAAVANLGDADIDELAHIHRQMRQALRHVEEAYGHAAYLDLNQRFHFLIYETNASSTLTGLIETLWLQVGPYLNLTLNGSREWFKSDQHLPILDAIRCRDAGAAGQAVRENIGNAAEFVLSSGKLDALSQADDGVADPP